MVWLAHGAALPAGKDSSKVRVFGLALDESVGVCSGVNSVGDEPAVKHRSEKRSDSGTSDLSGDGAFDGRIE